MYLLFLIKLGKWNVQYKFTTWNSLIRRLRVNLGMYCFSNTRVDTKKSCRRFNRVGLVFFRAKIVHSGNVSFLYLRTASSAITIHPQSASGCRTSSVGQVLLSSQGSHPASRELKPCVPVEAFFNWGHLDVDGFLEQQLPGVPGYVNHCGLLGAVVLPCMLRYCRLLQGSFPAGFLVFSQPGLQPSPGLANVALATTTGDSVHHLSLLHWQRVLHLGQH